MALLPLWDCDAIRCPDPDAHTQAAPASAHAPRHPLGSALAGALTRAYAALQERAGRKVGIALGEAWRAAFRAAASSGVDTVVLGDSRSRRTLVGLAAGLERAWGPVLGGAAAAAAAGGVVASAAAPEGGAGGAAVLLAVTVPLAVAAWPLVGPLAEITLLGNRSAEGIEEAVRLHTSIQARRGLWGCGRRALAGTKGGPSSCGISCVVNPHRRRLPALTLLTSISRHPFPRRTRAPALSCGVRTRCWTGLGLGGR